MKVHTKRRLQLLLILLVAVPLAALAWPREEQLLGQVGIDNARLQIRRGLDLQGGAYLVYEADVREVAEGEQDQALENLATVLKRRADPTGTSEVVVQTASNNRVVVQYPGVEDVGAVTDRLGRTAQLLFLEVPPTASEPGNSFPLMTNITGADVARAQVDITQQTGQVTVSLQMKGGESTSKFADLTTRLNQEGGQLVVLLDQQVVFGPAPVSSPITNGQASLAGVGTIEEAQEIASLINAGALPVPVELVAQRTIGPTLGALSIKQSLVAAAIGLLSVAIFLVAYYRLSGAVAVAALAFYTIATVAIYKLSTLTPYTIVLSLGGVAGFILSIAVAADASILVLERAREEAAGSDGLRSAVLKGYRRAWTSIRDANLATIIGTIILYQFGTPIIRGFAVTLGVGIGLSLLVLVTVTKQLLLGLVSWETVRDRPRLSGLVKRKVAQP